MTQLLYLILALTIIKLSESKCGPSGLSCFCNANLYTPEQEIIAQVDRMLQQKEDVSVECLQALSGRGYYKAALKLFEQHFLMNQIDVSDRMRTSTANNRRALENLITTMMSSKATVQNVRPVIQWAQNKDNIFINLKLAMRQDSPACLVCQMEAVNFTDDQLFVSFFGVYSHQPLRFELDFLFNQPINASESTWKLQSVGTLFFNLAQATKGELWLDLQLNQSKQIPIWWDMRDNHQQDMDQWIQLLEQRENQRDNEKQLQKQKEKEEKQKQKNEKKEAAAAASGSEAGNAEIPDPQTPPPIDDIKPEEPKTDDVVIQKKEDM